MIDLALLIVIWVLELAKHISFQLTGFMLILGKLIVNYAPIICMCIGCSEKLKKSYDKHRRYVGELHTRVK